ncbi:MAG TPA: hypothetical protein VGI97_00635 [Gemmatimonadaceae bacterium]|jgi:hypothetical protein
MFDQNLMFSDSQNLAAAAGTVVSTNSVDTWRGKTAATGTPNIGGPLTGDFGRGNDAVDIVGIVTQAFTSAGAATLQIQVIQTDNPDLTGNVEMLRESRAQAAGTQPSVFTAGRVFTLGKPPSMTRRYLGLAYVIGAATTTAGKITAGLGKGVPSNTSALLL